MALIKCPECGKEVSDRAGQCPNCGYPVEKIFAMKSVGKNVKKISVKSNILDRIKMNKKAISIIIMVDFFFSLIECETYLFFSKFHQVFIYALEDQIYFVSGKGNLCSHGFLVSISIYMRLFKKDKIDTAVEELDIQFEAFLCISAHS